MSQVLWECIIAPAVGYIGLRRHKHRHHRNITELLMIGIALRYGWKTGNAITTNIAFTRQFVVQSFDRDNSPSQSQAYESPVVVVGEIIESDYGRGAYIGLETSRYSRRSLQLPS